MGEGGVPDLSEEQLASLDKQAVEYEITLLEERLKQLTPNMAAIEEYRRKVRLLLNMESVSVRIVYILGGGDLFWMDVCKTDGVQITPYI